MICPLMSRKHYTHNGTRGTAEWEFIPAECQRENCAWWDTNWNVCSIFSIAVGSYAIGKMIEQSKKPGA